ncbi:MAG: histidinol-phosphate transaminase [Verrucomicrobia bacterium]|nr:histidinol-phosphate transaminase [Verrucomicrobiota bacterium]
MKTAALNRRHFLKNTGSLVAGLALSSTLPTRADAQQRDPGRGTSSAEPIRLGSNENNYGPSPLAIMAVMQNTKRMLRYPHTECDRLLTAIAAKEGVTKENLFLGTGSADVLEGLADWIGAKKGEVVTSAFTFNFFATAAKRRGATLIEVPLTADLFNDIDTMAAKITPATTCVYLVNPNNPTGTLLPAAKLRATVIEMARKCPVVVDEAYLEYADDFTGSTLVGLVKEGHNVIVTRTFSKIYALAGERLGYGVMPAAVAKEAFGAYPLQNGFRANMLGVLAATASLGDTGFVEETRVKLKTERDKFCALLGKLGRKFAPPQGNFVFFHVGMPAKDFSQKMRAENIVINAGYPQMPDWARLTIGTPEEMVVASAAVEKILTA